LHQKFQFKMNTPKNVEKIITTHQTKEAIIKSIKTKINTIMEKMDISEVKVENPPIALQTLKISA